MCFSSTASFGAGLVLSVIGVASIRKAREPKQLIFASIPLLFAIQQVSEGFLWMALTLPAYAWLEKTATYTFLTFAQILWPLYVPLAIFFLEKEIKRKNILLLLSVIGLLVCLFRAYFVYTYGVHAEIIGYHISYYFGDPTSITYYGTILYFVVTVFPPFISRIKHMRNLGAAILISFIFAQLFFAESVISVWCFFAALISSVVYVIMLEMQISFKNSISALPVAEIKTGTI